LLLRAVERVQWMRGERMLVDPTPAAQIAHGDDLPVGVDFNGGTALA